MILLSVIITILFIVYFFIYTRLPNFFIREISYYFSLFLFMITIFLWILYNPFEHNYQYNFIIKTLNINLTFGIDGISLLFIFLTTFLIPVCILYNWNNVLKINNEFYIILISLEIILILIFTTQNLLFFYICFELILMPLFILIGINNYRTRRIHAAFMLFIYTLTGSLLLLSSFIFIYLNSGSFDFNILYKTNMHSDIELLLSILIFLGLAVKVPLFPFYIWLPEAHVEAPTEGSILLAGILLKLGIYGYIRILIPLFYESCVYLTPLVFLVAIISGLFASFSTLRQIDIKRTIAYSSIAHMSIGILGLFTLQPIGIIGSILLMFSHGIVSGALFLLTGILYDRFKTKTIMYYNGLVQLMPLTGSFFFLFILGNISLPGTSSFIGESLILMDLVTMGPALLLFVCPILLLCTLYSLLLFNKIFFGVATPKKLNYIFDMTRRELHLVLPFLILMLWLGIYPNSFITLIESNVYFSTFYID